MSDSKKSTAKKPAFDPSLPTTGVNMKKETLTLSPSQKDQEIAHEIERKNAEEEKKRAMLDKLGKSHKPKLGSVFTSKNQKIVFVVVILIILIVPTIFLVQKTIRSNERQLLGYAEDNLFVWSENAATRIDSKYKPIANYDQINNTIQINAVRNEYEATQLVVRPLSDKLGEISIDSTGFYNPDNQEIITPANISIQQINLSRLYYFDRLISTSNPFSMEEDRNYPFLFTVFVPADVPAGDYKAEVLIHYQQTETISIIIKLHVYNVLLPVQRSYQTMIKPHTTNTQLMNMYISHRLDFAGIPMTYRYNSTTQKVEFNWTEFDILTQYAVDLGQSSFEISSPNAALKGMTKFSAEYNNTIIDFYSQVATHLGQKGWLNKAYIYELDEPNLEQCVAYEPFCQLVHQANSSLRVLLTTAPREEIVFLYDDIDIWAPIEHDVPKYFDELKRLQALGAEIVYYPCLFPKSPYANLQMYNPLIDTKVLGWQVFRYGLDGFLYWQTIAYYYNQRGYGYNGWYDGWLFYPVNATAGIYDSSLRWDILRDGFEDIEIFFQLKTIYNTINQTDSTDVRLASIQAVFAEIENLLPDFRTFSQDPQQYLAVKHNAASLLESLS